MLRQRVITGLTALAALLVVLFVLPGCSEATLDGSSPAAFQTSLKSMQSGLSVEETAQALGISKETAKADWRFARAWLSDKLSEPIDDR